MEKKFEKITLAERIKSMLAVDFRRMFTIRFFYIMAGIALIMPILILVMTSLMEGTPMTDSQTGQPILDEFGNQVLMEGFKNVWQMIGSVSGASSESTNAVGGMDIVSMCNINLVFFMSAVLVCIFIADDFRSGYAKNLFTVRSKKTDYVISKTAVCFVGGGILLVLFFIGTMLGGKIAGIPFTMEGFNAGNVILCMISKIFLMAVFVAHYALMSIIAKQKLWLSILLSLGSSMLLFTMIPMITPINAGIMNVILCIAGGAMFSVGLGAIGRVLLKKRDIL